MHATWAFLYQGPAILFLAITHIPISYEIITNTLFRGKMKDFSSIRFKGDLNK